MFRKLIDAINCVAREVRELRFSQNNNAAVLGALAVMEERINMKLSQVKADIAAARADSAEAFSELGTRIADLDKQIADLVAAATDPDITDEAFLADLNTLKTNSAALKDIVPGSPTAPPA